MKNLNIIIIAQLVLLFNTANGQIMYVETATDITDVEYGAVDFADVDGDGDLDLVLTGQDGSTPVLNGSIFLNDGSGNFSIDTSNSLIQINKGTANFADIDNDSDMDLLITGNNYGNRSSVLYKNDGNGNFSPHSTPFPEVDNSMAKFSDIDGDNDLDVIIIGQGDGNMVNDIFKNDGLGNFSYYDSLNLPINAGSIAFADINGDNDQDLMVTGIIPFVYQEGFPSEYITRLYENDGNGNFTEVENTPFVGVYFSAIKFADIDGDNDNDLLITGLDGVLNQGIANFYINDGNGHYTAGSTLTGVYSSSIDFGDIDTDGDLDVVLSGLSSSGRVTELFQNDGNGNFTTIQTVTLQGLYNSAVQFADVDEDGDLDLLTTGNNSSGQESSLLYINNSTLSIEEFRSNVYVYPNPFKNKVHLKVTDHTAHRSLAYRMYDINGKLIIDNVKNTTGKTIVINGLQNIEKGVYFLQILDGNNNVIENLKLIKK